MNATEIKKHLAALRDQIAAAKRRGDVQTIDELSERVAILKSDLLILEQRGAVGILPGHRGRIRARC